MPADGPRRRRPIRKLLIANRGEITCRIARSARAMGIETVGVHSDADRTALHVDAVDESIHLPGVVPAETYLRGDLLVDAARRTGADAVHPGYGFLSESASFATECAGAGLAFVGPPADVIARMGSKIEAKELMHGAGVPVLPACGADDLERAITTIGLPVLVKAAFGGGGRGMRIALSATDLADAVASAQREAEAAFGDGTVFLERFVERPRHIEVQVLGDAYGAVVHLHERECSIQRRHQKIIEEAPAPTLDPTVRESICAAAVTAARAVGYENAGTVEFVVDRDGRFFFLEVNTRLQVEHPVTELVTGLDLVELQLRIAQGEPLPEDLDETAVTGHAVEARLYAEDARAGYLPVAGRIERLHIDAGPGVRVDAGYRDGSTVSVHYDAMLAKVIAWAPSRDGALARLADVLARAHAHGIATNRDLLVGVLRHPEFVAGDFDTGFLDRHPVENLVQPVDEATVRRHAIDAERHRRVTRQVAFPVPQGIPPGWRNVGPARQPITYTCEGHEVTILGDDLGDDGRVAQCSVHVVDDVVYVDSVLGATTLREHPRFPLPGVTATPGSLCAPMPGRVVVVEVGAGQPVASGDVLVVMEAMKMEHSLLAPDDGVVSEIRVGVGDQVEAGAVLVVVDAHG